MVITHVLGLLLTTAIFFAQSAQPQADKGPLTVETIMFQVAANQDRSEMLRKQYSSAKHIRIATNKSNGKMMREETADYDIVPTATETRVQLRSLTGRYWHKGKLEDFKDEPVPAAGSWDADYIRDLRMCLTGEQSRCTQAPELFPLTSEEQKRYEFRFMGQETLRGRGVYHIGFMPKDTNPLSLSGEAFIDAADLQPVRVFTNLTRRVPFVVRIALGTDVSGLGYNIEYKRLEDGNYLPASYGTEYEIRLLFHINRTVSVSMDTCFEPGEVSSLRLDDSQVSSYYRPAPGQPTSKARPDLSKTSRQGSLRRTDAI
jgi:hypothetical protein